MLTYEECIDLCGLTQEEVDAIAEHEHIDPIIAAALGNYLITHQGEPKIRRIIMEDIEKAEQEGNKAHAEVLRRALCHFVATHPKAQ